MEMTSPVEVPAFIVDRFSHATLLPEVGAGAAGASFRTWGVSTWQLPGAPYVDVEKLRACFETKSDKESLSTLQVEREDLSSSLHEEGCGGQVPPG